MLIYEKPRMEIRLSETEPFTLKSVETMPDLQSIDDDTFRQ